MWKIIEESTVRAPRHATTPRMDKKGNIQDIITKEPTGSFVEAHFVLWRCSLCRALGCTAGKSPPSPCSKCNPPADKLPTKAKRR